MATEPVDSLPAHALVRTWLRDRDRHLWPWIDVDQLERVIASLGTGADPLDGEEPLAALFGSGATRGGLMSALQALNPIRWLMQATLGPTVDWHQGALITDERLIVRDWQVVVDAPFSEIHEPTSSGGLSLGAEGLSLRIEGERPTLTLPSHRALQRFLAVATEEARADRIQTDRVPAPYPESEDPSGARGFARRMKVDDERGLALLAAIAEQVDEEQLTEWEGLDLAQRVALLHRATIGGRGSHGGFFVSCLRRDELLGFFEAKIGAWEPDDPVDGVESVVVHRSRGDLRLVLQEQNHPVAGDWCGYKLDVRVPDAWQPMSEVASEELYRIHQGLLAFEAQVLLRRVLCGPALSAEEVLELPGEQVDEARAARMPHARARWFQQPRGFQSPVRLVRERPERRALRGAQIPRHLPTPPSTSVPGHIGSMAMINAFSGLFTLLLFSTMYCFGGVAVLAWAQEAILARIPGLDEDATTGALTLVLMMQWMLLLVVGPLRLLLGVVMLLVPRSSGWLGWFGVLLSVAGLLVADVPGFFAGMFTAAILTRPSVREYLTS